MGLWRSLVYWVRGVRCPDCGRDLPYGPPVAVFCHSCRHGYVRDGVWIPYDACQACGDQSEIRREDGGGSSGPWYCPPCAKAVYARRES